MARVAVFLRGMNLGRRRIKNDELFACFERLGFSNVVAFLASGNVALSTRSGGKTLEKKIETGLAKALDYAVPTFVRSEAQLRAIAEEPPFANRPRSEGRGKPQVALLKESPTRAAVRSLQGLNTEEDWLQLSGRDLFWWPRGGVSQSKLDMKALEKLLGPFTVRTHGTFVRMVEKCFDPR